MANDRIDKYRLIELRKSDFEIADGEPDIRGWKVKNNNDLTIGEVVELLFDPFTQSVRYLLVHIDGKPLNLISRTVLIPIGLADIHEEFDDVILPKITVGQLASLPTYKRNSVTPVVEKSIRAVFSGEPLAPITPGGVIDDPADNDHFYEHEHFDEERLFRHRRNKIAKDENIPVVEEQVHTGRRIVPRSGDRRNQTLTDKSVADHTRVRQRAVDIDRPNSTEQPATRQFAPFQEGAIEITEHKEVPVVSKEARVVEEISVNKDIDHHDETIRDTVRHTEVDVEEFDSEGRKR